MELEFVVSIELGGNTWHVFNYLKEEMTLILSAVAVAAVRNLVDWWPSGLVCLKQVPMDTGTSREFPSLYDLIAPGRIDCRKK